VAHEHNRANAIARDVFLFHSGNLHDQMPCSLARFPQGCFVIYAAPVF